MSSAYAKRFTTEFHRAKDIGVLVLNGELDNSQQNNLQTAFENSIGKEKCSILIVDITHINYIASFAVAAIGFYYKELNDRGGCLYLVSEKESSLKPFKLAGLSDVIPVFNSIKDALADIKEKGLC
ncbi:MAG: STAS domain-containing protein [Planctomycetota bacterium]|jgi:stage II sporulation protein AA (anti-sigma F factor antagonist)